MDMILGRYKLFIRGDINEMINISFAKNDFSLTEFILTYSTLPNLVIDDSFSDIVATLLENMDSKIAVTYLKQYLDNNKDIIWRQLLKECPEEILSAHILRLPLED